MKAIRLLILIIAVAAGLYFYFHKEENFKVNDSIIVSQASGMDMNAPITAPPKFASISGTITNITKKNFNGVEIVYLAGTDTLRVEIGRIPAGQSSDFTSKSVRVISGHPDYRILNILSKEE
jgi:uncharacterized protein (UPF0333 family)